MTTIEARLVGDWAETYPKRGHLALILPLALEGTGTIKDMRLRVEGVSRPLSWAGCWYGGTLVPRPAALTAPITVTCVFRGEAEHQPAYLVTLEGRTGWTWQAWAEVALRPGVARYVMRPGKAKTR